MLDWLDTSPAKTADISAPVQVGDDSGEVRGGPIFPVSRFRETPEIQNREGSNPHGYEVSPVSRFSRFQNKGGADKDGKINAQCDDNPQAIPEHLPELLDAVAAILTAGELDHLRAMSDTEPDTVVDACRLILTAPTFPTLDAVAELDGLIVRLCGLVPWLSGFLPELQAARYRMAPADVADNLARFRRWVSKAEGKGSAAGLGRGGKSIAL